MSNDRRTWSKQGGKRKVKLIRDGYTWDVEIGRKLGKTEIFDDIILEPEELKQFENKVGTKAYKEYLDNLMNHIKDPEE